MKTTHEANDAVGPCRGACDSEYENKRQANRPQIDGTQRKANVFGIASIFRISVT